MENSISYKNWHIRAESFQREKNGTWIAQYTVVRQEGVDKGTGFPSSQYQFSEALPSESEANKYALQKAREWIDRN
jgi:hypothetical protein